MDFLQNYDILSTIIPSIITGILLASTSFCIYKYYYNISNENLIPNSKDESVVPNSKLLNRLHWANRGIAKLNHNMTNMGKSIEKELKALQSEIRELRMLFSDPAKPISTISSNHISTYPKQSQKIRITPLITPTRRYWKPKNRLKHTHTHGPSSSTIEEWMQQHKKSPSPQSIHKQAQNNCYNSRSLKPQFQQMRHARHDTKIHRFHNIIKHSKLFQNLPKNLHEEFIPKLKLMFMQYHNKDSEVKEFLRNLNTHIQNKPRTIMQIRSCIQHALMHPMPSKINSMPIRAVTTQYTYSSGSDSFEF